MRLFEQPDDGHGYELGDGSLIVSPAPSPSHQEAKLTFEPDDVLLAVEVVSPASKTFDRALKPLVHGAARIPSYWRVEIDEGPALYVHDLDGDSCRGPQVHAAGVTLTLSVPFPVAFDPADLI
ncbi:Uma2 family endonuclease [Nonomuraea thailandensis]|uniref:Uma2 family endonuclease n=1 Tax=Nonomuraea thailandensis TaxID=1188745 RepID=A0A9X2K7L7_9ACTN|nr:Uma2 family endonuclease [Nonomuraea thailandensis]MCP2359906.1 Uma2 family endonuclease [Nonomuraea thailandensis]